MVVSASIQIGPEPWRSEAVVRHALCLLRSFRHWTGRELISVEGTLPEPARVLFEAPFVLLSHNDEPDPVLNYGNRLALWLWETDWAGFTGMPSRLTAERQLQEERARLLAEVAAQGFSEGYSGVRISCTGRRFRIEKATVWNVLDEAENRIGQAAMFCEWRYLDSGPCG